MSKNAWKDVALGPSKRSARTGKFTKPYSLGPKLNSGPKSTQRLCANKYANFHHDLLHTSLRPKMAVASMPIAIDRSDTFQLIYVHASPFALGWQGR